MEKVPIDWDSYMFNSSIYPDAQSFVLHSVGLLIHAHREKDIVIEENFYDLMLAIRKEDMFFRKLAEKQTSMNLELFSPC